MTGTPWVELRTHAATLLPQTCAHVRPSATPSALGGRGTDTTLNTALPCRLARLDGTEAQDPARAGTAARFVINLPYGTDVREQDALIVGGRRFEVVGFATADTGLLVKAVCQ